MKTKRGLSEVVVSTLLVLIALSAIIIIWSFVSIFLADSTGEIGTGRFTASYKILEAYDSGEKVNIRVQRNPGEGEVIALNIILTDINGNSKVFRNSTRINELETRVISAIYAGSNLGALAEVSIAPVFEGEKIGSVVDTYTFGVSPIGNEGFCGDGVINVNEFCDSNSVSCNIGGLQGTQSCLPDCSGFGQCVAGEFCGNGNIDTGEECDDGNSDNGDGCSSICLIESFEDGHNFKFSFDSDGYLRELNWTSNGLTWKRISWSEQNRFPQWRKVYLHSTTGSDGTNLGWKYYNGAEWPLPEENEFTEERHSQITYTKVSETPESVLVKAESSNIKVEDRIHFSGNTMFINITITNKKSNVITTKIPVNLGGLQFQDSTRYRLIADKGGRIVDFTSNAEGGEIAWNNYPNDIGSFSPVSVVWDSSFTIGEQYLTEVYLPTTIEFIELGDDRHEEKMKSVIITEINPGQSKTFSLAFKLAPGSAKWKETLSHYKDWFYRTYSDEPNYCPTSNFAFFMARNNGNYYNSVTNRWNANTKISDIYRFTASLSTIGQIELENFIFHSGTSLHGYYLNNTPFSEDWDNPGFNPTTELIDPNIDAGFNPSKIEELLEPYLDAGVNPIWYLRPCTDIPGADITYDVNGNPTIIKGNPTSRNGNDLRVQTNIDRQMSRIDLFKSMGVKGFYLDAAGCPGDEEFFRQIESQYPDVVNYQEGARDRNALERPQIPIFHSGDVSHSNLLFWLVPDASYYRGKWGADQLTTSEINEIINLGYQVVVANNMNSIGNDPGDDSVSTVRGWMCGAYENQLERFNSYGNSIGCSIPSEPSFC